MSDKPTLLTLVTGASGFVGNNLVRHLLQLGRKVRALIYRDDESLRGLEIDRVTGDVRDPAGLKRAMQGVDVVYHLVAAISIDNGQSRTHLDTVNVEGTANVVQACLDSGVQRLIHFSSIHAISYFPKDTAISESRDLALDAVRHLPYDHAKAKGELQVLKGVQHGLDAVILNPVGIFGPNDFRPSPTGELLLQLAQRKLPALVRAGYYWVDVRDVVRTALAAEQRGRCGQRYILAGEYATFKSIADWIQQTTGAKPPRLHVPIWLARPAAPLVARLSRLAGHRPLITPETIQIITCHQKIATNRAREELGFRPRSIRDSVRDSINWLLDHAKSRATSLQ